MPSYVDLLHSSIFNLIFYLFHDDYIQPEATSSSPLSSTKLLQELTIWVTPLAPYILYHTLHELLGSPTFCVAHLFNNKLCVFVLMVLDLCQLIPYIIPF